MLAPFVHYALTCRLTERFRAVSLPLQLADRQEVRGVLSVIVARADPCPAHLHRNHSGPAGAAAYAVATRPPGAVPLVLALPRRTLVLQLRVKGLLRSVTVAME